MLYGNKIKHLRENKELKQKQISEILEISYKAYNHFENEYTIIPIKHLNTLCNYFDVSLDYIFSFNKDTKYQNYNKEINTIISGSRLKEFRKQNKITQVKLANILNTTQSNIAEYERGKNIISTPFLYTICKKYHISADYLLGKIDYEPNLNNN